jgi:hypothetical protein
MVRGVHRVPSMMGPVRRGRNRLHFRRVLVLALCALRGVHVGAGILVVVQIARWLRERLFGRAVDVVGERR